MRPPSVVPSSHLQASTIVNRSFSMTCTGKSVPPSSKKPSYTSYPFSTAMCYQTKAISPAPKYDSHEKHVYINMMKVVGHFDSTNPPQPEVIPSTNKSFLVVQNSYRI